MPKNIISRAFYMLNWQISSDKNFSQYMCVEFKPARSRLLSYRVRQDVMATEILTILIP